MDLWLTVGVIVLLVVALARELAAPAPAMVGSVVALVLLGVVEPELAFAGLSAPATLIVAGLFVVARALREHGGLGGILERRLGGPDGAFSGERVALARLVGSVTVASAAVNNTPLVASLAPVVRTWADRRGMSPARFLMPLSFAAILGGTLTTIGTSTTLVASGILRTSTGEGLALLEVTALGLPIAVAGGGLIVLLAPRLLPDRTTTGQRMAASDRDYTFRQRVVAGGPLVGRTIAQAQLRDLQDVFLARVDRGPQVIAPARPGVVLADHDELVFVGRVEHVRGLPVAGLEPTAEPHVTALDGDRHGLHEVVVGRGSRMAGRTLKETSFRGHYGAAVLAIHRSGTRVESKLGEVELRPGDSLLLQADEGFVDRWRDEPDFAVVAPLDEHLEAATSRRWLALAAPLLVVVLAATGLTSTLEGVLLACAMLVLTGTVRFGAALRSLDLEVLLVIASAIGLGAAVEGSGLAAAIAETVQVVAGSAPAVVALLLLLVATTLLTELVTNVASAALMVPIALESATLVGQDPRAWAIATAVLASQSFLTPIGYQTNTIVYGLGGYRFGDYWRLGLPLVLAGLAIALVVTPML